MKNFLLSEFIRCDGIARIILSVFFASALVGAATTIKDKRDGQTYKVVKIKEQEWLAENLRYSPKGAACTGICKKLGFMYNWNEAMKACPEGWALPDMTDWAILLGQVRDVDDLVSKSEAITRKYTDPQQTLKSKGRDVFGFGALTYGQCMEVDHDGKKQLTMNCPVYWTSRDELDDQTPLVTNPLLDMPVAGDGNVAYSLYGYIDRRYGNVAELKKERLPVRCISEKTRYKDPAIEHRALLEKGLVDRRDNHVYSLTLIDGRIWMAENLNFATGNSWCYGEDYNNCARYGRLYTWASAVGKSEEECGRGKKCNLPKGPVQGICPDGWHLPSMEEFKGLSAVAGLDHACTGVDPNGDNLCWHEAAARNLHAPWGPRDKSQDILGFDAQAGGTREGDGTFVGQGNFGFYWTSDQFRKNYGKYAWFGMGEFYRNYYFKESAFSVRCVKND